MGILTSQTVWYIVSTIQDTEHIYFPDCDHREAKSFAIHIDVGPLIQVFILGSGFSNLINQPCARFSFQVLSFWQIARSEHEIENRVLNAVLSVSQSAYLNIRKSGWRFRFIYILGNESVVASRFICICLAAKNFCFYLAAQTGQWKNMSEVLINYVRVKLRKLNRRWNESKPLNV